MPAWNPASTALRLSVVAACAGACLGALVLPLDACAGDGSWQLPVGHARVQQRFAFDRSRPYLAGQRRVVRLRGAREAAVRAPCSGTVTFAGPLPRGRGETIRCGRLAATLTGLGAVGARRGSIVVAGQPVGRLSAAGTVWLGARVAGSRHGYLDPLSLIGGGPRPPAPLAPAPRRLRPPRSAPRAAVKRHPIPRTAILMGVAWLGLGLAGSAMGVGLALRRPSVAGIPEVRARHAGR